MFRKMKNVGYARKRDANEPEIIAALEAIGCTVYALDKPLDLLVGHGGKTYLLEVKDGAKPPSWQRVTDDQQKFLEWWEGGTAVVVNSVESAYAAIEFSSL